MNEFVSWCRHLLVSFLFHALTSLHPPSFHRNDFSTCIYRLEQCSQIERRQPPTVYILALLMWLKLLLVYVENYYAVDGKVVVGLGIHRPPSASVIISTEVYCVFSPASCICIL